MKIATCLVMIFAMWMLLSWSLDPEVVVAGAIISVIVALPVSRMYPDAVVKLLDPRRWFWLVIYVPYMLYHCLWAALGVAYRVLHPDVPIRPGMVMVTTTLKTNLAKTLLANSITLTPGTLVVDMVGQELHVHLIYMHEGYSPEDTHKIVGKFEALLRKIFE